MNSEYKRERARDVLYRDLKFIYRYETLTCTTAFKFAQNGAQNKNSRDNSAGRKALMIKDVGGEQTWDGGVIN